MWYVLALLVLAWAIRENRKSRRKSQAQLQRMTNEGRAMRELR